MTAPFVVAGRSTLPYVALGALQLLDGLTTAWLVHGLGGGEVNPLTSPLVQTGAAGVAVAVVAKVAAVVLLWLWHFRRVAWLVAGVYAIVVAQNVAQLV